MMTARYVAVKSPAAGRLSCDMHLGPVMWL